MTAAKGGPSWTALPVHPLPGYPDQNVFLKYRESIRWLTETINSALGTPHGSSGSIQQTIINSIVGGGGSPGSITASAPLAYSNGNISIPRATATADGYLAMADYQAFSAKLTSPMTTLGDLLAQGVAGPVRLPGSVSSGRRFLRQQGTGSASSLPVWDLLIPGDLPLATTSTPGAVIAGAGTTVAPDGTLSTDAFVTIADAQGNAQFTASGADKIELAAGSDMSLAFDATNKRVTFNSGNNANYYVFSQNSPATTWTINHTLNQVPGSIVVLVGGQIPLCDIQVDQNSPFTVTINFKKPQVGTVYLSAATCSGAPFVFSQTSPATTWTINHGLGKVPSILVLVGGQEPIANISVLEQSPYTVTVSFKQPQVGTVYLQ